ncbi:MAG: alpha/beta hydrolase [Gammaproteobacteria bacterium]|nr:alpha/beta hydrolase [Gammaproteobacteria bacterium]MCW5583222.1 alpha/beta hydrolase [Gammaproteobacteria bacterium]
MNHTNIIIIHGAYGYPNENWFGWLNNQLQLLRIPCHVPSLPSPEGQNLLSWLDAFNQSAGHLVNENTILIGHSLGAAFIFRWLEQHPCQLKSVITVGAFIGKIGVVKFDLINESFFQFDFDWNTIKLRSQHFVCYYGTNDNYVSRQQFENISTRLNARKIIVSKGGHFNIASGYAQFPHLLFQLKQMTR